MKAWYALRCTHAHECTLSIFERLITLTIEQQGQATRSKKKTPILGLFLQGLILFGRLPLVQLSGYTRPELIMPMHYINPL
jgi:hypothetical protein